MLIHKIQPGESLWIRGEIEIKNLTDRPTKLGCIGDGEVSTDAVPLAPVILSELASAGPRNGANDVLEKMFEAQGIRVVESA